ncbi:MAG: tetratricopeptide repeat protein [Tepidisphaeraceae bacterium]|jgi:predicted Zn-dependent protease
MALNKKQQLNGLLQAAIDSYHAGQLDEAINHLSQSASDFPKAAKLWGYLGFLYAEAGEDVKAAQAFRKAASISPHSEQASLGLFHSLWRMGKTNAAFDEMRRYVKSNDSPRYRQLIRDMLAEAPGKSIVPAESLVVA